MSKIVSYRLELDAKQHPVLVKEKQMKYESEKCSSAADVVEVCNKMFRMKYQAEEIVCLATLDNAGHLTGLFKFSQGCCDSAICRPREIFIRVLLAGASGMCLVHNHTSGEAEPSTEDLICIDEIKKAGVLMGIRLLDFIIIGKNTYYSAAEEGILT